jgi:putative ABC transport system permease protein
MVGMKLYDYVLIAWKYIKMRFFESFIIIIGIALGVGVVSSVFALSQSLNQAINRQINLPFFREIRLINQLDNYDNASPITKIGAIDSKEVKFTFADLVNIKRECPQINYSYLVNFNTYQVEGVSDEDGNFQYYNTTLNICGITDEYFYAYNLKLKEGSYFTFADIKEGTPLIILGSKVARKFFYNKSAINHYIKINGMSYKVIGVFNELNELNTHDTDSPWSINSIGVIPFTISKSYQEDQKIRSINLAATNIKDLKNITQQLQTYLNTNYDEPDAIRIIRNASYLEQSEQKVVNVLMLVAFFSGVVLLIASVNILNLMIARVMRRIRDIGILKAIGGSRRNIFILYLNESLLLSLGGALIGVVIAFGLVAIIGPTLGKGIAAPDLSWGILGSAILVTSLVSIIFGIFPAYQASKIKPVEAICQD